MKKMFSGAAVLLAMLVTFAGCAMPMTVEPTGESADSMPILWTLEQTTCYSGAGFEYQAVQTLDPDQYFRILAIDDDIAWFQIDPTAIINPDPPDRPLEQSSGSEMQVRCWVPGSEVETEGDLSGLPIIPLADIPAVPPTATVLQDSNCRSGPSRDYPVLSLLSAGAQYEIRGRNQQGDYWLIFDTAIQATCWIYGNLVAAEGDLENVEIVQPPPPPVGPSATDTPASGNAVVPVDCSQYNTNPAACNADPACQWDPTVPPNGVCKNK
jgi:hypothetical protein